MIQLNNNVQIVSDGNQYIVKEVKKTFSEAKNEFVERENVWGYCHSLDRALNVYTAKCIRLKVEKEELRLNEVQDEIKKLRKEIEFYK